MEESDWWDQLSLEEILAMSEPEDIKFVDRRPKKAISLRVEEGLISEGKRIAGEVGIGYQTLFRMWLIEGLTRHREQKPERRSKKTRSAA
jgi:predicted DNA binding CopG/RHH family protein